ncbi:hypothetical protein U732_2314 [Clostridium argentinense CDC 2741]|uniref:Uncharacterized protein n=1 Tax=Clostridium argentinense CDC 2741 TaxID=1418104 RepID=A0A0C1UEL4_9CLOT|nr:hypothetical protein [Clostridium argentinense]ARC83397.1 hypothetical protein RSJ17_02000 [Clostridium argentinense]KIE45815.1 hypothetical protein U732_2314 [Clostridium argentinense CDC 2741]NFF39157.1 hypothetical protein [Clostridium argentinense]NFP49569.1 hypothetical protein [Clostridium argentinense]NFP72272.1 hypothetical protein [Clostridium argentinense]
MKSLLVGNGINIQFGGYENTNEAIIVRGIKALEKDNFPKHIILENTEDLVNLIGYLFMEFKYMMNDNYNKFTLSNEEQLCLDDMRKRYKNRKNLILSDIGFEDYYLIYDLFCHKNNIVNPEKFYIREAIKTFFIYSIFNNGKVNEIYIKYPEKLRDFFVSIDNIFTTNYDENLEKFTQKGVYYLHGSFNILDNKYKEDSFRNMLTNKATDDFNIDKNYYYLYSNVLTTYSGFGKNFSMNQSCQANEAIKKMANGYQNNPTIKKDVDSWKFTDNEALRNMYDSIILKVNDEKLEFEEQYPVNEFKSIKGELIIIGLSPNNDTHIFKAINNNGTLKNVTYYYYDKAECDIVSSLLSNFVVQFLSVKKLWKEYK